MVERRVCTDYIHHKYCLVTSVQNDIGEEEATLVLRHEIGGTSARLCIIYKQSTFTRLFFTQQKIRYQIPPRKRHGGIADVVTLA